MEKCQSGDDTGKIIILTQSNDGQEEDECVVYRVDDEGSSVDGMMSHQQNIESMLEARIGNVRCILLTARDCACPSR